MSKRTEVAEAAYVQASTCERPDSKDLNAFLLRYRMRHAELTSTDVGAWPEDRLRECLAIAEAGRASAVVRHLLHEMERRGLKKDASPETVKDGNSLVPESPEGGRCSIISIPVSHLQDDRENARKGYDPDKLSDLASSIRAQGVIEPLIVKPTNGRAGALGRGPGRYVIVAGHRRRRAAEMAGLKEVPCIVREDLNGTSALAALVENLQREDLSPLDESRAYVHAMKTQGLSAAGLASAIGKGARYVQQRAAIATGLIPAAQKALAAGAISASHADELSRLAPAYQERLWKDKFRDLNHYVVPLRQLREALARERRKLQSAPWKLEEPKIKGKGIVCETCSACPHNTGGKSPVCENPTCYEARLADDLHLRSEAMKAKGSPVRLISEQYLHPNERKALPKGEVLDRYNWAKAKQTDKGAVEVLVVESGKTQWMKKTSSSASNDNYSKRLRAQERKRKEKEKAAKAAADAKREALLPKIKAPLSRELRVEVVCFNFQRMWAAIKNPILRRHGWDKLGDDWSGRKVRAEIAKLADDALARLEIEMVYEWGQDASELSQGKSKGKAKSLVQLMEECARG